jgi:hypothetical protein
MLNLVWKESTSQIYGEVHYLVVEVEVGNTYPMVVRMCHVYWVH